ncbi:MAG: lysophospholipid acyltransferase family protein [Mucilaginibacter sp.]
MIPAKKNRFLHWFFYRYINYIVKKNFHAVNFNAIEADPKRSVLMVANHFSWWDGFILYYISYKLLNKRFHIMVLEETMRSHAPLKYMGAFSVAKNSRDIVASLDYAAGLLNDPGNLVVIYPQGKLYSNFVDEVIFDKGAWHILNKAKAKTRLMFAATFIENFEHKKPVAYVYMGESQAGIENISQLTTAYQQHYAASKARQQQIIIE